MIRIIFCLIVLVAPLLLGGCATAARSVTETLDMWVSDRPFWGELQFVGRDFIADRRDLTELKETVNHLIW